MTHNQWEQGKRLTIHNATKEQLKFMVREKELMIQDLTKQLDEKQKAERGWRNAQILKSKVNFNVMGDS